MTIFEDKCKYAMPLLIKDFGFSKEDAAAVMGNLGHETGGFKHYQEIKPVVPGSKGGFGWAQWTGPRRREFEAYCSRNNLDPYSDKANYGFLFVELKGPEKRAVDKVKSAVGLYNKTIAFENSFERSGVKAYASRYEWACKALLVNLEMPIQEPPVSLPEQPKPEPEPLPKQTQSWFITFLKWIFGVK